MQNRGTVLLSDRIVLMFCRKLRLVPLKPNSLKDLCYNLGSISLALGDLD